MDIGEVIEVITIEPVEAPKETPVPEKEKVEAPA